MHTKDVHSKTSHTTEVLIIIEVYLHYYLQSKHANTHIVINK